MKPQKTFNPDFKHQIKQPTHNEEGQPLAAANHRAVADAIKKQNKKPQ